MSSTMRVVLGQIGPAVMLPMLVYEIGSGAIMPIVALVALDSGASTAVASLMLAAIGIGTILGDVPAAWLANRLGERRAMIVATLITAGAMFACLVTTSIPALAVALLVLGASTATLMLARQSYVAEAVAVHHRARAMSTLGGVYRIGLFIGPFAGLPVISIWGTRAAFAIPVVTSLIAALILLVAPTPEGSEPNAPDSHQGPVGVSKMFGRHRHLFLTLGVAVASVGLIRAARQAVIPLWAAHIGLSAATISLIFGVANFVDMALFYPSGHVMDKFGRLTVAIPCMVILGITTVAIPLSHGPLALGAIATVMSFGNGIGSGIIMTLGADVSPPGDRNSFLAIFRLITDLGSSLGPVVPAVIATVATLSAGIAAVGVLGLAGAVGLARWVPRYSTYATPAMAREHHRRLAEQLATPTAVRSTD